MKRQFEANKSKRYKLSMRTETDKNKRERVSSIQILLNNIEGKEGRGHGHGRAARPGYIYTQVHLTRGMHWQATRVRVRQAAARGQSHRSDRKSRGSRGRLSTGGAHCTAWRRGEAEREGETEERTSASDEKGKRGVTVA